MSAYRAAGYDFLVLTDHFEARWGWRVTDTAWARDASFTTLPGAELSSADWDDESVFWVNAIGLPPDFAAPAAGEPHDALLARGHRLHVAAGDDAHWLHPHDRFGAWTWVRAETLEPAALLEALKAGAYYSTQGPEIHAVDAGGDRVHVTCSPARAIALTGIHGWRSDVAEGDPLLQEATLDLGRLRSPYWRLTVTAEDGRRAWTNPVWY